MRKTVAIVGTLDTKEEEFLFLRDRIREWNIDTLLIDCGVMRDPNIRPDVTAHEIAKLGGSDLAELRADQARGRAVSVMGEGARLKLLELYNQGHIHGVIGAGGSSNTSIAAAAMRDLPVGVPKLIVSTFASGDVSSYVGINDVTMMHSVGDIEGINRLTSMILSNAAGAIAGMVLQRRMASCDKPTVGITMFGVTTPAVKMIRSRLEARGFEVLVFHATGAGGRAMEALVQQGVIKGVIDLTTTELADEVVGGVLSAGADRLRAGVVMGIPQVISCGAIDIVNLGPFESIPAQFRNRTLYMHTPEMTLMRTSVEENERIARMMIKMLEGVDPRRVTVMLPVNGVSMVDDEHEPFFDPQANAAFRRTFMAERPPALPVIEVEAHINSVQFADAVVEEFISNWECTYGRDTA